MEIWYDHLVVGFTGEKLTAAVLQLVQPWTTTSRVNAAFRSAFVRPTPALKSRADAAGHSTCRH
jgi:hypothetical protein